MKTNLRPRHASRLPHLRWTSYAIAAGATAAGAIPIAEAEIHYSGPVDYQFHDLSTFKRQNFPLSNGAYLQGAFNDVRLFGFAYAYFGVDGAGVSNSLRGPGSVSGFFQLAALPGKSVVSDGNFFPTPGYGNALMQSIHCINPYWQDRGVYYVGFRFNTGAGPQYGWVRIRWSGCNRNDFIVKDYAWGDVGDKIKTGQKHLKAEETQAAPTANNVDAGPPADSLGSLGLLALGAVGFQAWRAKRTE